MWAVDPRGLSKDAKILARSRQNKLSRIFKAVLEASATSVGKVVKTTVFLKNMEDFATVNKIYEEFFSGSENKPARSAVEVARLLKDVLFEIECIAG
ncbi:hypothetical protein AZE42_12111 [Rhizopogon vesiculosus]|uniref:Uncharacterized protein n=1 Tax=Rhizopogon vesiculosus TaxID=180088 RepID=A0A1J8Q2I1_9AGAM|nr:hypothetical protein AZE42_12111 [Rhizopogon vesiculosus]